MYIGNDLQVAESGNKIIDDISSSFNGSTTSFALLVGGAAPVPFPINTQQIYISVNGVIQEPDPTGSAGFKLLGNNIVFSSAPANGHAFFGVILSGADYVTVGTEFPAGSATAPSITFGTDNDTGLFSVTGGTMGFTSDGTQTFTMDGNGFNFPDGKKVNLGSSSDLSLYHDGSNTHIDNNTGHFFIRNNVNDDDGGNIYIQGKSQENSIICNDDGAVELYYNNVSRFATTNTGTDTTGVHVDEGATHNGDVTFTGDAANVVWDKSVDDLIFYDNAKAVFGSSSDCQILHDGTDSFIQNKVGDLRIANNVAGDVGGDITIQAMNGEDSIKAIHDGAVELYHNNVKKFETYASGIIVYGAEGADGLLNLYADEGDDNADKWRLQADTNGSFYLKNYTSGSWETNIRAAGDGTVELYHNNSKTFETTADGIKSYGTILHRGAEGGSAQIRLEADEGDDAADMWRLIANTDGTFCLQNYAGGGYENTIKATGNGNTELYHNNSKTFETLSVGAQVTGSLGINTSSPTSFNANADELVLHNGSGTCGMTISSPNDSIGRIAFADPEDNNIGEVKYEHSSNSLIFVANASERMRVDSSGRLGIQGAPTKGLLDVRASGGSNTMLTAVFGANEGTTAGTLTDGNDKGARLGLHHYDNDEEPFALVSAGGTSSANAINFGGGTSMMNAATSLGFYTAANNTTTTGTKRLEIKENGAVALPDGTQGLRFGSAASQDFAIYHSGSNSHIDHFGTGNLYQDFENDFYMRFYESAGTVRTALTITNPNAASNPEFQLRSNPTTASTNSATHSPPVRFRGAGWNTSSGSEEVGTKLQSVHNYWTGNYSSSFGQTYPDFKVLIKNSDNANYVEKFVVQGNGDARIKDGNLIVASDHGIKAYGADNSTYGDLDITVAAADGSGSNNVATFKRGSNSVINLAFPSGGGIDFSSTGNSSGTTNSELFHDYEEGSFTPTVEFGAGGNTGLTLSVALGRYTKIGRVVRCDFTINFSAKGTSTGGVYIASLPYTSNDDSSARMTGIVPYIANVTSVSGQVMAYGGTNVNRVPLYDCNNGSTILNQGNINNDTLIRGVVTYNCH